LVGQPQRTSPSLRRGLASNRLFASLDRCQALIIRSNSRICPLSIRSRLTFFVRGVKTNFQLAPKIASIRVIGQSSANKSFLVGHRGFPAIAEIAPRLRIVMPFSRAHFPILSRRIRAPHPAGCLACLGTPIRSWSFIATALSLGGNSWHPARSSAGHWIAKASIAMF
jgi:hypothetical protein